MRMGVLSTMNESAFGWVYDMSQPSAEAAASAQAVTLSNILLGAERALCARAGVYPCCLSQGDSAQAHLQLYRSPENEKSRFKRPFFVGEALAFR
jgi:hypothetical protein